MLVGCPPSVGPRYSVRGSATLGRKRQVRLWTESVCRKLGGRAGDTAVYFGTQCVWRYWSVCMGVCRRGRERRVPPQPGWQSASEPAGGWPCAGQQRVGREFAGRE
jgi:hypothetical protein